MWCVYGHLCTSVFVTFLMQEVDLKAGGGYVVAMGEVVRTMMTKLDWFGTLFPRIPVNVQRELEDKIRMAKLTVR